MRTVLYKHQEYSCRVDQSIESPRATTVAVTGMTAKGIPPHVELARAADRCMEEIINLCIELQKYHYI